MIISIFKVKIHEAILIIWRTKKIPIVNSNNNISRGLWMPVFFLAAIQIVMISPFQQDTVSLFFPKNIESKWLFQIFQYRLKFMFTPIAEESCFWEYNMFKMGWNFHPVIFIIRLCGSLPVTVTTRIITFLVRDHRESLWTLISHCSWEGPLPIYIVYILQYIYVLYLCSLKFNSKSPWKYVVQPRIGKHILQPLGPEKLQGRTDCSYQRGYKHLRPCCLRTAFFHQSFRSVPKLEVWKPNGYGLCKGKPTPKIAWKLKFSQFSLVPAILGSWNSWWFWTALVTTFRLKKNAFGFFRRIIAVGRPPTVDDDDDDDAAEASSFRVVAKAKVVGTYTQMHHGAGLFSYM